MGQSAVRKKAIKYYKLFEAQNLNIDSNRFKESKCFISQCFSIQNFTYNTQWTQAVILSSTPVPAILLLPL